MSKPTFNNRNSFGPSYAVKIDTIDLALHRYPDPRQTELKQKLVKLRNVESVDNFFIGVGSDESIDLALRCFCSPGVDKILITPPTYGMYRVCAHTNDVGVVSVPLNDEFQLEVDQIRSVLKSDPNIKICFLCSPGNPTGMLNA